MTVRFHHAALIAALAALTGCSTAGPDPYLTTQAVSAKPQSSVSTVAPQFAAAQLPQLAGPALLVRQSLEATASPGNRLRQQDSACGREPADGDGGSAEREVSPAAAERGGSAPRDARHAADHRLGADERDARRQYQRPLWLCDRGPAGGGAASMPGSGSKASTPATRPLCRPDRRAHRRADPAALLRSGAERGPDRLLMDGLTMRPISGATIDMLRYAAGSGVNAAITPQPAIIAPVGGEQACCVQAAHPHGAGRASTNKRRLASGHCVGAGDGSGRRTGGPRPRKRQRWCPCRKTARAQPPSRRSRPLRLPPRCGDRAPAGMIPHALTATMNSRGKRAAPAIGSRGIGDGRCAPCNRRGNPHASLPEPGRDRAAGLCRAPSRRSRSGPVIT